MAKAKTKLRTWTESEMRDTFALTRVFEVTPTLENWIDTPAIQAIENMGLLTMLQKDLIENTDYWNEQELELFFIAPLLKVFIDYKSPDFLVYSERAIEAQVEGIYLKTEPDLMLAKGVGEVLKVPYFCFHEYKRTKKNPADPIAQVLEAMLIAQVMNKNEKPVYGAYVIGKDWYFMVMEGKKYCISDSLSAINQQDLLQIIAILRKFRVILETTLL